MASPADSPATPDNSLITEFRAEKDKVVSRLALFEVVDSKLHAIAENKKLTTAKEEELKDIQKRLNDNRDSIGTLEATIADRKKNNEIKKDERKAKTKDGEPRFFSFLAVFSRNSDSDGNNWKSKIKAVAELAEENAQLLREEVAIVELGDKVKAENANIVCLNDKLLALEKALLTEKESKAAMNADLESALKEWKTKYTESYGKDAHARTCDASTQPREAEAYPWTPLAIAGARIRSRKLEWVRGERPSEKLIEYGNQASHYGMVLADAALYRDSCPMQRTDVMTFITLYGVEPKLVWSLRLATKYIEVLDWRGAMKDFCGHSYTGATFETTKFNKTLAPLLEDINAKPELRQVAAVNAYFETKEAEYKVLKEEYGSALKRHKAFF